MASRDVNLCVPKRSVMTDLHRQRDAAANMAAMKDMRDRFESLSREYPEPELLWEPLRDTVWRRPQLAGHGRHDQGVADLVPPADSQPHLGAA